MKVDTPSPAYVQQRGRWDLLHDLLGGTAAMREAGQRWLPKEPKERIQAYRNRLHRSILFNAFRNTVNSLASKPYAVPVTVTDGVPESLVNLEFDADRNGTDLTQFARLIFEDATIYGLGHFLVDSPRHGKITLKEQRDEDIRPYFVRVNPRDLIGWNVESSNGRDTLTQIRIKERRLEQDGEFGSKIVEYIKVWTPTEWSLHRKAENGEYVPVPESEGGRGVNELGYIPLVTIYFTRTGTLTADPPLEDLAWLNLAHWQSDSDQRNILRFARVGMISATGITQEEFEAGFAIGANQVLKSTSPEARFDYVEHGGKAIEAGRQDGKDIEARMEVEGLRPMLERTANVKATGVALNENRSMSNLQAWIRVAKTAIERGYEIAAEWSGQELKDDFEIGIFNDFGISLRGMEDAAVLLQMVNTERLSHETFLQEIRRRGIVSDSIDVKDELSRIENQGPALEEVEDDDEDEETTEEDPALDG